MFLESEVIELAEIVWSWISEFLCPSFQLQKFLRPAFLKWFRVQGFHFSVHHATEIFCWQKQISQRQSWICWSTSAQIPLGCCFQWFHVGSYRWCHYHLSLFIPFVPQDYYTDCQGTFRSPCPHLSMEVVAWLEWMTGGSFVMSSKCNTPRLMVCDPLIEIILGNEGSVMSGSKADFVPTRLEWDNFFVANLWRAYSPSHGSSGGLLR